MNDAEDSMGKKEKALWEKKAKYKRKFLIFKCVFTWSPQEKKIRLFRITYAKQKQQVTFGLQPRLISKEKTSDSIKIWLLGIVFHWHKAGGGYFPD